MWRGLGMSPGGSCRFAQFCGPRRRNAHIDAINKHRAAPWGGQRTPGRGRSPKQQKRATWARKKPGRSRARAALLSSISARTGVESGQRHKKDGSARRSAPTQGGTETPARQPAGPKRSAIGLGEVNTREHVSPSSVSRFSSAEIARFVYDATGFTPKKPSRSIRSRRSRMIVANSATTLSTASAEISSEIVGGHLDRHRGVDGDRHMPAVQDRP
jgi:hypothetical protein